MTKAIRKGKKDTDRGFIPNYKKGKGEPNNDLGFLYDGQSEEDKGIEDKKLRG